MKRFTETTKWANPWFMDLPVKYKTFWFYICDQCDCAGVWEPNMRLAMTQIGEPMELIEILRVFEKRIEQTLDGKLWIKGFIKFQYGIELNPSNSAHLGVIRRLETNKIKPPVIVAPDKGLRRGLKAPQDKDKDKDKDKKGSAEGKQKPANQQEVEDYCEAKGLPRSDGQAMWLHWQEKGMAKIKDWRLTILKWQSFGYLPSQNLKSKPWEQKKPDPKQQSIDREYQEAQNRLAQRKRDNQTTAI